VLVNKIIFGEENRDGKLVAMGVLYSQEDGRTVTVHANREVVVCAGTFGSPKVLELSGIGQRERLAAAGAASAERDRQPVPDAGPLLAELRGDVDLSARIGGALSGPLLATSVATSDQLRDAHVGSIVRYATAHLLAGHRRRNGRQSPSICFARRAAMHLVGPTTKSSRTESSLLAQGVPRWRPMGHH